MLLQVKSILHGLFNAPGHRLFDVGGGARFSVRAPSAAVAKKKEQPRKHAPTVALWHDDGKWPLARDLQVKIISSPSSGGPVNHRSHRAKFSSNISLPYVPYQCLLYRYHFYQQFLYQDVLGAELNI